MFPRERWLTMPPSYFAFFRRRSIWQRKGQKKNMKGGGTYAISYLICLYNGGFHLTLMMKSSVMFRYTAHWKDQEEKWLIENWTTNQDLLDLGALSPLPRLHHTWKKDGPTNAPLGAEMNLCKPKRAISESMPMKARLFPHLQPLTAATLNQCLWKVWLGRPPLPPQSNACLLLYILSVLFTFRCLHPHHFYSFPPKGAFYCYYKI